ncbi:hypothetical protein [Streptomyces sp. NPDC002122]|uniref:hypothetical protein n=1 Tax=Streptomyces sp. NPDC002122 TaxID=3154407 RepID=UPI0033248403
MGIGTPVCMAPEQAVVDRQLTDAADLVELTEERATGAVWPAAVGERIGERAAFASEAGRRTRPDEEALVEVGASLVADA